MKARFYMLNVPRIAAALACCIMLFCNANGQDISSFRGQKPFSINGSVQLRGVYYTRTTIAFFLHIFRQSNH
jgi:hypothetical protein